MGAQRIPFPKVVCILWAWAVVDGSAGQDVADGLLGMQMREVYGYMELVFVCMKSCECCLVEMTLRSVSCAALYRKRGCHDGAALPACRRLWIVLTRWKEI